MANTKVQYVGDGATKAFSIPFPYIDRTHVVVKIDDSVMYTPSDYWFTSASAIETKIAPVQDSVVEIRRQTPIDSKFVNFQNGAILTEQELDLDSEQAFYLLQENQENYSDLINDALTAIATANGLVVTDPELVLSQLVQNMIDSAEAAVLAARITDIDDNAQAILSNANAIVNENLGRIADYGNLQGQINSLVAATVATVYVQSTPPVPGVAGIPDPIPEGARWYDSDDNNAAYLWDDVNLVWLSLADPQVGANAAAITALQVTVNDGVTGVAANAAAIGVLDTTVTAIDGEVTANAADITQLQADLSSTDGTVAAQGLAATALTARVTATEGATTVNAGDITTLNAALVITDGNVTANGLAISALTTRVSDNEGDISSQSSLIIGLQNQITANDGELSVNAGAISTLESRATAIEGVNTAQADSIVSLQGQITANDGDITAAVAATNALTTRVEDTENATTANAGDITALAATVNDGVTGVAANASGISALIISLGVTDGIADANALAITALESTVNGVEGVTATAAAVSALTTRVSTAEGTITSEASLVDTLQSEMVTAQGDIDSAEVTIAAHTSAISTAEGDITALEARYGVSLNVNGYVSGFSLNNSGTTSDFVIMADKFAIVDPTGDPGETEFIPFLVSGGVVTMQNVQISGNLVVNGTLAAGAFQTLTGGLADIDVNMGDITAGTITLDTNGYIRGGQTAYDTGSGFFLGYSGAAYKFSIGNGSDQSLTWDGTTLTIKGDLVVGEYIASDTIILSATTERTDLGPFGGFEKYKEFDIDKKGVVRFVCDYKCGAFTGGTITPCTWELRRGSTVLSAWGTASQTTYTQRSVDCTIVNPGDNISLWMKGGERNPSEPANVNAYVRNAYIKADVVINPGGSVLLN